MGMDRRDGSIEDGVVGLRESIEIYERLGAARDVARVAASLRALGAPRGRQGSRRRPETGWESLTPTESSVVQLVADGLRNRDIGSSLHLPAHRGNPPHPRLRQARDLVAHGAGGDETKPSCMNVGASHWGGT